MILSRTANADLKEKKSAVKATILIVDDQEMVRTMVADLLGGMNYSVLTAKDGVDAIEMLRGMKEETEPGKSPVDLIILDMILPKIDGRETYRRIKEIDPDVKVVLSTGYDVNNIVSEVLSDGAVGFIQKPYHIDKLVGMVRQYISQT